MQQRKLVVAEDAQALVELAYQHVKKRIAQHSDAFSLSLAGGSTPKGLYQRLATAGLPWERILLLWGDERYVPQDHPDSNARMVRETLLAGYPAQLERERIFPWPYQESPTASAESYELILRERFSTGADLMLLGMGDDGHTASLFPDTAALTEKSRWAVANRVEKLDSWRLTVTYPFLALSREIVFLVSGAGKAKALADVLERSQHPSGKVTCKGTTRFFVDKAAAAELKPAMIEELTD